MTREEAIALLCYGDWLNVISEHIGKMDTERIAEAMSIVGKAFRPVSREQVEKVWRGEWKPTEYPFMNECEDCSVCGYRTVWGHGFDFCPVCGAAQTDKAVEMVIERLEALQSDKC